MIKPAARRVSAPSHGTAPRNIGTARWHWQPEWTLHVDCLDADHRLIGEQLGRLALTLKRCVAWSSRPGAARVQGQLELIGDLTRRHFLREEQIMRAAKYPTIAQHQAEHVALLTEYAELVRAIRAAGAKALTERTATDLQQWFLGHVLGEDRALALFLRRSGFDGISLPEPLGPVDSCL